VLLAWNPPRAHDQGGSAENKQIAIFFIFVPAGTFADKALLPHFPSLNLV
jgi:hypothetical protein